MLEGVPGAQGKAKRMLGGSGDLETPRGGFSFELFDFSLVFLAFLPSLRDNIRNSERKYCRIMSRMTIGVVAKLVVEVMMKS